jgi:predicted transcriptional regulator YdeE
MASLGSILTGLFTHRIEGTEPRIVELEHPMKIMGMSVETSTRNVYRDVARLGKQFEAYKQEHEIPETVKPWAFAAVSKDYDETTGSFSYIMGDVVASLEQLPEGLMGFVIPAGTYAVFPVRPKNRFGWGMAIGNVKRYAYTVWLPASGYEQAGTIDDFEYHDERSEGRNPEIDLYVAVRRKG